MKKHNPYGPIMAELFMVNDMDDDESIRAKLRATQSRVKLLRDGYYASPSNIDYSSPYNRAAYLLAYYPHHIETIYHVLTELPKSIIESCLNKEKLRAVFLGAGPGPEVVGLAAYLNDYCPDVSNVVAYLFDKHADGWHKGQEITRYHLVPQYWPGRTLVTVPIGYDLLDPPEPSNEPDSSYAQIAHPLVTADLLVMQNCLNDQLGSANTLLPSLKTITDLLKPGAIAIVIDLYFDGVKALMLRIEEQIIATGNYAQLLTARNGFHQFQSQIDVPQVILDELLTGEDKLKPRRNTKYYVSAFQPCDPDDIPF
ncbi:MAG: hypothetical protein M1546_17170 [Chloroflexi bacterium]|nr:hypothetical protein [Chloroflexota bacterium]